MTPKLFTPLTLGPLALQHRVVMAPLTRSRAHQPGNVPSALNACYYAQRASAALIISEATRSQLKGQYDIRPLGSVTVKGKSQSVAIYEVRPS